MKHPRSFSSRRRSTIAAFDPGRRAFGRQAAGLAALAGLSACGGGGGSDAAAALVLPVFLYAFVGTVESDDRLIPAQVSLTLTPQVPSSPTGSFVSSTLRITFFFGTTSQYKVTGTFSGEEFSLVVEGAASPIAGSYRGSFVDRNTVRLVPSDGSLRPDGRPRPVLELKRDPALT